MLNCNKVRLSQGHIRLVPIPVVFSAMSKVFRDSKSKRRADSRLTPTFVALLKTMEKALQASTYAPVLHVVGDQLEDRNEDRCDF